MLASAFRMALRRASPGGARGRLSVLIYHRVLTEPDPLLPDEPSAVEFEQTMQWVKRVFNVIPLVEGISGLQTGRLPERALSISFDDGYANNASIAAPILARLGLHATFFVATGFLDGGRMFNDTVVEAIRGFKGDRLDLGSLGLGIHGTAGVAQRLRAIGAVLAAIKHRRPEERGELAERVSQLADVSLPTGLMMSSQQVRDLVGLGFAVGGHTVNHPILVRLPVERARAEIENGKRALESITGKPVELFAYPNGRPERDYGAATTALVRQAGFKGAVSTSHGAARVGADPFQVPRFTPWDRRPAAFLARLWLNLGRVHPTYVAA